MSQRFRNLKSPTKPQAYSAGEAIATEPHIPGTRRLEWLEVNIPFTRAGFDVIVGVFNTERVII